MPPGTPGAGASQGYAGSPCGSPARRSDGKRPYGGYAAYGYAARTRLTFKRYEGVVEHINDQTASGLTSGQAIAPVPGSVVRSVFSQTNMKYLVVIDSFTGDVRRLETRARETPRARRPRP